MAKYRKAPIVEAVIEYRFNAPIKQGDLARIRRKLQKKYPNVQETFSVEVVITEAQTATQKVTPVGFQMNSSDGVDLVLLQQQGITTSRLAPYQDWETLLATSRANLETSLDVIARPQIIRVATRYINRLDIPIDQLTGQPVQRFLHTGVLLPDGVATSMNAYSISTKVIEAETLLPVTLQSASVPSVLIEHQSFTLDIDVSWESNIPTRLDEMWSQMGALRTAKNNIFEALITDATRELLK